MSVDRSLVRLILVIVWLNGVHTLDHMIRGDFHWPLDGQSVGFVLVVAAIAVVALVMGLQFRREVLAADAGTPNMQTIGAAVEAVSYTHLTLPTTYSV